MRLLSALLPEMVASHGDILFHNSFTDPQSGLSLGLAPTPSALTGSSGAAGTSHHTSGSERVWTGPPRLHQPVRSALVLWFMGAMVPAQNGSISQGPGGLEAGRVDGLTIHNLPLRLAFGR